ncbi:MAG: hypothetical protein JEZ11_06635 [Desulfobacterales bacterium]|nr:hypothetical protein [Desulfobacterales bacterium]
MTEIVDPKLFGLPSATCIEKQGKNAYAIVIRRKSRIIMKDGRNILAKAEKIRAECPGARISVQTTAPVCSKTRAFLMENGIPVDTSENQG